MLLASVFVIILFALLCALLSKETVRHHRSVEEKKTGTAREENGDSVEYRPNRARYCRSATPLTALRVRWPFPREPAAELVEGTLDRVPKMVPR